MKLTKKLEGEILKHAKDCHPQESCGVILIEDPSKPNKLTYLPQENISSDPLNSFELPTEAWMAGDVVAVVHSHPNGEPLLSGLDRQQQTMHGVPWALVTGQQVKVFPCVPHLRGREFDYGKFDCGTLVADAYNLAGIQLPYQERGSMEFDTENGTIENYLISNGFVKKDSLEIGDVLLIAFNGQPCHVAIYIGNENILHHALDQLSRIEPYYGYYIQHTESIWRHPLYDVQCTVAIQNDLGNYHA